MRDLNKFKGCLIGGAVGDAIGYAVEFLSASSIFNEYGENGITEYELRNGVAEISDDTQMTLFTATGLLLGTTRGMTRGIMRVASIGIYFAGKGYSERKIDMIGAESAAMTHGHELGYIPAAMLIHILQRISERGDTIAEAVEDSISAMPTLFPNAKHMRQLIELVQKAVQLSQEDLDDLDAIRQLGEGWVADETLAIAVYCALKYADDFDKGIIAAVNHDGDSDSTGAVAGNILGTALGFDAIPQKFIDKLELKDIIFEIAEDLYHDCKISEYGPWDDLWASKYVEMTYMKETVE